MKAKLIFIIPKHGLKVIDPMTRKPIDSNGQYVEKNVYWQRRIKCGDVVQYSPDEIREVKTEPKFEEKEEQQIDNVGGDE